MKQLIKYIAVILSLSMMANYLLTSSIMEVNASDEVTVSGNETDAEGSVGATEDETIESETTESGTAESETITESETTIESGTTESETTTESEIIEEEVVTIIFDFNGGDGDNIFTPITEEELGENKMFGIWMLDDIPTYANHKFTGWLCSVDNMLYGAGESKQDINWNDYKGKEITFTAQWEEVKLSQVTILYVSQSENMEYPVTQDQIIQQTDENEKTFTIALTSTIPAVEYYKFNGWISSIDNTIYSANAVIEDLEWEVYAGKTITFTADWVELPTVTIEFVRHDGECIKETIQQIRESDSTFDIKVSADDSENVGYEFTGWLCNMDGITYGTEITSLTLLWEKCANKVVIFTAQWEPILNVKDFTITESGIFALSANVAYKFSDGSWKVDGESYSYAGGNTFYAETEKTYTFQKE